MFVKSLEGIETWQIHPHVFVNYINPKQCIDILKELDEETVIVINGYNFIFRGDLRNELLETKGDLYKLLQWYKANVTFDLHCEQYYMIDSLIGSFYKAIKAYLPRRKKKH